MACEDKKTRDSEMPVNKTIQEIRWPVYKTIQEVTGLRTTLPFYSKMQYCRTAIHKAEQRHIASVMIKWANPSGPNLTGEAINCLSLMR